MAQKNKLRKTIWIEFNPEFHSQLVKCAFSLLGTPISAPACVTNVQVSVLNLSASIGLESQNGDLPHSGYSIYTKLHYLVVTNNK